jgi:ParB-like nuclease domain
MASPPKLVAGSRSIFEPSPAAFFNPIWKREDAMILAITYRAVADLKPYPRNARTHSRKQVKQIAAAIKEFGFTNPVLIDENDQIIAGHGRVAAVAINIIRPKTLSMLPPHPIEPLNDSNCRTADQKVARIAHP